MRYSFVSELRVEYCTGTVQVLPMHFLPLMMMQSDHAAHAQNHRCKPLQVCALVPGSYRSFNQTWRSMREHLIEPLAASGVLVETVMCLDKDLPTELKSNVHTGLRVVHLSAVGDLQLRQQGRSFAGFQREAECFQRALQRELACVPKLRDQTSAEVTALLQRGQHASKAALRWSESICAPGSSVYDFFLFARPDLLWLQPFPVEALLERNAVSLRARDLCFDPNAFWFSEQAQSAYHLRCASCGGCFMVPDDQFALVPRRFGAAYFAEHRFFEATVPNRTLAEREQEYTVLLSHVLMTISSNITRGLKLPCEVPNKPNVAGNPAYTALCNNSGFGDGTVDENTVWSRGRMRIRTNPNRMHRPLFKSESPSFGAEALKSFRLNLRSVPLVLRGFPVYLTGWSINHSTGEPIINHLTGEPIIEQRWSYKGDQRWPNASRSCMLSSFRNASGSASGNAS